MGDQYTEFVIALSGSIDAKSAVRILRGHDDLINVFRRKFAPRADLAAIKAEIKEEDMEGPHPPPHPPHLGIVKEELPPQAGGTAPFTPSSWSGTPARNFQSVKHELVKTEGKSDIVPHPPAFDPQSSRRTVTVGDDSDGEIQDEASIAAAIRKGPTECIAQLVKTLFRKERAGHVGARSRLSMVHFAAKTVARPRFPRQLFLLRGLPGVGKSEYAMQQLIENVNVRPEEELAARLTHICAMDDFCVEFKDDDTQIYNLDSSKLETYHSRNETRIHLAMEAGIHPLYVDCPNMRLWEMHPYVALADRLGYVTTVVEPHEICEKWDDVDFLVSANDTSTRQQGGKVVPRGTLMALAKTFEPSPVLDDTLDAIRSARRPVGSRVVEAQMDEPTERPRPTSRTEVRTPPIPYGQTGSSRTSGPQSWPQTNNQNGNGTGLKRPWAPTTEPQKSSRYMAAPRVAVPTASWQR